MTMHYLIPDMQHNGAYDAPLCNQNLGIFHHNWKKTEVQYKVTCERCLKAMSTMKTCKKCCLPVFEIKDFLCLKCEKEISEGHKNDI